MPEMLGDPKRREQDLKMMRNANAWPTWPRLPLKRYVRKTSGVETGVMVENPQMDNTARPVVYLGTLFDQRLDESRAISYDSLEAVVDDGWLVD